MSKVSEQYTTSGAVKIHIQRQKKVLGSRAPSLSKAERARESVPLVHGYTIHVRPKDAAEGPPTPNPAKVL